MLLLLYLCIFVVPRACTDVLLHVGLTVIFRH
jgi:hypothetical protein